MTFARIRRLAFALAIVASLLATSRAADAPLSKPYPSLQDAVILIIRHAEKPTNGFELSPAGRERAQAYVHYFQNFTLDSTPVKLDSIFATADSTNSHRPRLTIEPLAAALNLKIDNRFKNKNFQGLVAELQSRDHGKNILIAWHHGEIPSLAQALGADPAKLLPKGVWPDQIFCWVLELRYDHEGRLIPAATKRINEHLMPGDADEASLPTQAPK
jgi:broad specificity phosphatase PhoE